MKFDVGIGRVSSNCQTTTREGFTSTCRGNNYLVAAKNCVIAGDVEASLVTDSILSPCLSPTHSKLSRFSPIFILPAKYSISMHWAVNPGVNRSLQNWLQVHWSVHQSSTLANSGGLWYFCPSNEELRYLQLADSYRVTDITVTEMGDLCDLSSKKNPNGFVYMSIWISQCGFAGDMDNTDCYC